MDQGPSHQGTRRRRQGRRLLTLAGLLLATGCGQPRGAIPQPSPPLPVPPPLRKQVLQGYMPFDSIGWVSNNKVVFSGLPVGSTGRHSLYLWDLKGMPRLLLQNASGSCVRKGNIRASQLLGKGRINLFNLSAPDFTPTQRPPEQPPRVSSFDPVSCSWIETPQAVRNHTWQALRKGEGFLDFTPDGGQIRSIREVQHLDADARTRQDTGIRMTKPMIPMAVHSSHDGSYLVYDLNQDPADEQRWIEANNRTIWRLDRQLQGHKLSIPAGPWVGIGAGTIAFLPARPGVLITSNNFSPSSAPGGAGLYLLHPDASTQRLEQGLVERASVSPDGCRVAYGFRPRLDTGIPEGGPRLVVLDLCTTPRNTPATR